MTKKYFSPQQKDLADEADLFETKFVYLKLHKDDLEDLFINPPKIQKLVFRFQFISTSPAASLAAFGALNIRKFKDNRPLVTLERTIFSVPITGEIMLGNLEMSMDEFNRLWANEEREKSNYLIFSPKKFETTKNVTYAMSWDKGELITDKLLTVLNFDSGDDLNPSPPARPEGSEEAP